MGLARRDAMRDRLYDLQALRRHAPWVGWCTRGHDRTAGGLGFDRAGPPTGSDRGVAVFKQFSLRRLSEEVFIRRTCVNLENALVFFF